MSTSTGPQPYHLRKSLSPAISMVADCGCWIPGWRFRIWASDRSYWSGEQNPHSRRRCPSRPSRFTNGFVCDHGSSKL